MPGCRVIAAILRAGSSMGTPPCRLMGESFVMSDPLHDERRAAMAGAERAASALRQCEPAVRNLHCRMCLAAQLPHGLDHLGHAAAVRGVVVAQAAAVGI